MKKSTLNFPNGDKYEGELKGKKKHGYGVFTWADGSTFRGDWKDDKKHGHATFIDAKGEELSGYWKNGEFDQLSGKRTSEKIDLKYLKKNLDLKKLIKHLDTDTGNKGGDSIFYNLLDACSNMINNEDVLFNEIYEHNEKLKKKFQDGFYLGTLLPLISDNFKLENAFTTNGPVLNDYRQHAYSHQIISSKINKTYYVLVYKGLDWTNDSHYSDKKFKDKKAALNYIKKEQEKLLIMIAKDTEDNTVLSEDKIKKHLRMLKEKSKKAKWI